MAAQPSLARNQEKRFSRDEVQFNIRFLFTFAHIIGGSTYSIDAAMKIIITITFLTFIDFSSLHVMLINISNIHT